MLLIYIIIKHSPGWSFQIVELTTPDLDDERNHGDDRENQGDGQREIDDAHLGLPFFGYEPAVKDIATTVRELIGIRIAATSGFIKPTVANEAARVL